MSKSHRRNRFEEIQNETVQPAVSIDFQEVIVAPEDDTPRISVLTKLLNTVKPLFMALAVRLKAAVAKLASYCVLQTDEQVEAVAGPVSKTPIEDVDIQPFKYGKTIKITAASVAVLTLLSGGYLGYRTFLSGTDAAPAEIIAQEQPLDNVVTQEPSKSEPAADPFTVSSVSPVVTTDAVPTNPLTEQTKTVVEENEKPEPKTETSAPPKDVWGEAMHEPQKDEPITNVEIGIQDATDTLLNAGASPPTIAEKPKHAEKPTNLKPLKPIAASNRSLSDKSKLLPLVAINSAPSAALSSVYDKTASNFADPPAAPNKSETIQPKKTVTMQQPVIIVPVKETALVIQGRDKIDTIARKQKKEVKMENGASNTQLATSSPAIPKDGNSSGEKLKVESGRRETDIVQLNPNTLGHQLQAQVQELRNQKPEPAELNLRFESNNESATVLFAQSADNNRAEETVEPALRFTSKKQGDLLDMKQLEALLPSNSTLQTDTVNDLPELPPLNDPAPPVYANVAPKYGSDIPVRQEGALRFKRQGVRYVVQEGDTLFGLAMDKLHNSSRWQEILTLNADKLSDPWDLKPGMEILLPVSMSGLSMNRR